MDLLKNAFDTVEKTVTEAASTFVQSTNEFPDQANRAHRQVVRPVITGAATASRARKVEEAWAQFHWEGRQDSWQAAAERLLQLQEEQKGSGGIATWRARAQSAEQQLAEFYLLLMGLPDPAPMLESAAGLAHRAAELEAANRKLQADADSAAADAAEVASLIEKHEREVAAHAQLRAEHAKLQEEWEAARADASAGQQAAAVAQESVTSVSQLQAQLAALRREHELSQSALFEAQSRLEEEEGGRSSADELLAEEMERYRQELGQVTLQRDALRRQLERLAVPSPVPVAAGSHDAAAALDGVDASLPASSTAGVWGGAALAAELAASAAEVEALRASLEEVSGRCREAEHARKLLLGRVNVAEAAAERLQRELERRPTAAAHAALQRQLAALAALVGQQLEQEGWGADALDGALRATAAAGSDALQPLLQERARKLQDALTGARQDAAAAAEGRRQAEAQAARLGAQLDEAKQLVRQLEADLVRSSGGDAAASGAAALTSDAFASGDAPGSASAGAAASDSAALLPVVIAQRERLRLRVGQLEEEVGGLSGSLSEAEHKLRSMEADNVALVEKLRFLAGYGRGAVQPGGAGAAATVIRVDAAGVAQQDAGSRGGRRRRRVADGAMACFGAMAGSDDEGDVGPGAGAGSGAGPEARYKPAYQAKLNPFAEFRASEAETQLLRLPLHDKALLAGSRLIAGSRLARAFVAVYAVVLHVFVMLLLYYAAAPAHVALAEAAEGSSAAAMRAAAVEAAAAGAVASNRTSSGAALLLLRRSRLV